jgi:hypothetical protein
MIHGLFSNKVFLEHGFHRYYNSVGEEFMSFSKIYEFLAKKFNSELVAGKVAESCGTTKQDVLNEWQDKTDNGTRIDKALELYAQTGQILMENEDIADLVKDVIKEYSVYNRCYEQIVVYNDENRSAGSLDKLFLFTNRKDSPFGISDFKAFEKDDLHTHRGWLLEPFAHLPNTKYTKISFQLSYYAWHFEMLTGRRCKQLFIHLINPITKTHSKIPVMYMKNDVEMMFKTHGSKIKELLDAKSTEEAF